MKTDWPAASVDIVLLTIQNKELHVAVAPREGEFLHGELALIGGTIHKDKDRTIMDTVKRVLKARGGLDNIFLEQLFTFGSADQDPRGWSLSIAYYGLVPMHELEKTSKSLTFLPVDRLPKLPFIHNQIVETAVARVRGKGGYSKIPARLLPQQFSIPQMKDVYEAVTGREINMSAFRKKVTDLRLVEPTGKKAWITRDTAAAKPSALYKLTAGDDTFDKTL